MDEIGREQFCQLIHKEGGLRDIALCDHRLHSHRAATCSANTIKLIDVSNFKELTAAVIEEESGAALQHLQVRIIQCSIYTTQCCPLTCMV